MADGDGNAAPPTLMRIIEVFKARTLNFLDEELGQVPTRVDSRTHALPSLALRETTALVSVGPGIDLFVAYSYDTPLISAITDRYTAGLDIPAGEELVYRQETAAEIVNIIVGNSTADFSAAGELLVISPPVLLMGARTVGGRKDTHFSVLTFEFVEGTLDIAFIGPRHLFDESLNYCGGVG